MRRTLYVVGSIAVLAVASRLAANIVVRTKSCDKVGALPTTTFIGEALSKDGDAITYRVVASVDTPDSIAPDQSAPLLGVGQEVEAAYWGGGERFVHPGRSYRVAAYGHVPDSLTSGVHQPADCAGVSPPPGFGWGPGTAHADGSTINTGLLAGERVETYLLPVALVAAAIAATVGLFTWRRTTRQRADDSPETEAIGPKG